jgi:hypothetical protein
MIERLSDAALELLASDAVATVATLDAASAAPVESHA